MKKIIARISGAFIGILALASVSLTATAADGDGFFTVAYPRLMQVRLPLNDDGNIDFNLPAIVKGNPINTIMYNGKDVTSQFDTKTRQLFIKVDEDDVNPEVIFSVLDTTDSDEKNYDSKVDNTDYKVYVKRDENGKEGLFIERKDGKEIADEVTIAMTSRNGYLLYNKTYKGYAETELDTGIKVIEPGMYSVYIDSKVVGDFLTKATITGGVKYSIAIIDGNME